MLAALERLRGGVLTAPAGPKEDTRGPDTPPARRRRALVLGVGAVLLAVLLGLGVAYRQRGTSSPEPEPPPATTGEGEHIVWRRGTSAPRPGARLERAAANEGRRRLWQGEGLRAGGKVVALAFAPRGNVLAAAVADGAGGVRCWDPTTGHRTGHLWPGVALSSVAFAPDGKELAAGCAEGVRWWRLADGRERTLPTRGPVRALAFSPDGKHFAAAVYRAERKRITLLLYDRPAGRPRYTLEEGPASESCALAISFAQEPILAAAGTDGSVQLWDLKEGKKARADLAIGCPVHALVFSPPTALRLAFPGPWLGVGCARGVQFWKADRWEIGFDHSFTCPYRALAYSPDSRFWTGGGSREFRVRDLTRPRWRVRHDRDALWSVAFAPGGKVLAVGGNPDVWLWDVETFLAGGKP
jgi:WD40 repeat protein